jgi:hypothetical protein
VELWDEWSVSVSTAERQTKATQLPLQDELGPIPTFPPRQLDERGRLIPLSLEERKARSEAAIRTLKAIRARPDDDPSDIEEQMMRGIDANRPMGRKLFEGKESTQVCGRRSTDLRGDRTICSDRRDRQAVRSSSEIGLHRVIRIRVHGIIAP